MNCSHPKALTQCTRVDAAAAVTVARSLTTCCLLQMRVVTDGFARGLTILDRNLKVWNATNAWTSRPKVQRHSCLPDQVQLNSICNRQLLSLRDHCNVSG